MFHGFLRLFLQPHFFGIENMAKLHFGLQKLTLLDFPGKVACTVFTFGCNFRCPFCHNASLVHREGEEDAPDEDDILAFLDNRRGILDGVCISGGEPLCHPELPDFMKKIHDAGFSVKLDTNGSFPERLQAAVESHCVDYIAMDIKNAPEKYAATTASGEVLEAIRKSVAYLKQGTVPYEFRTTVVRQFHDAGDFEAIGAWIEGAPRYFLQSFADSGSLLDSRCSGVPKEEMDRYLAIAKRFVPDAGIRGME